ncbi:2,3-bisphosphoglycerate-independent phosphoglycerate mutase [Silvanigrella aquatica]|uniref:2,3-bisphosphoglycerate-independent phosphoglycerate mutase n=1 Tax=Silvanigrella aquatica TaxID=1915309 RepID=A0A1L4CZ22_9BACT|nr:2,3-bisphosphoglycerate-independent phosphoglycerate mutase [Silvanigrella aquatica]APJ03213.1 phosphoglycerate mutase (2,3-diphosphoglycerate-independent) [Silvanigrella aquatica]
MGNTKSFQLNRVSPSKGNRKILTIVMDGVGYTNPGANITSEMSNEKGILPSESFLTGNAVNAAYTPNLQRLVSCSLFRTLKAHGTAVGLPSDDDMGNSEVGHNALGAGRIFAQGAKLVNAALESGNLFKGDAWQKVVNREDLKNKTATLHLCGLLSDGNVHSHIDHLFALIKGAKKEGVKKIRLHMLLDGRDVGPLTAINYIEKLENFLKEENSPSFDCKIASSGGRTFVTMDRYESDWSIVERGYQVHILGEGRVFSSLLEAVEKLREEKNYYDQDLPPIVIHENGKPLGTVEDGDSFIFFNFRGDRAIEISRALTEQNFTAFPRKRFPKIFYAGMMQYDGDLKLPELFLVTPPAIDRTMTELLSKASVKQFACSETQKFGHVTYFWNGNRSGKFNAEFEKYVEIPSDLIPFQERPWMKSAEIADETIKQMYANSFEIGRINFANGDMVGHSGDFAATVLSVAAVDLALGRIMKAAKETNTILIVVADHGNADEMFELDKKTKKVVYDKNGLPKLKTSHTLSPVPFVIYNEEILEHKIQLKDNLPLAGLANVAATILELAGFQVPDFYEPSLIEIKGSKTINKKEDILIKKNNENLFQNKNFSERYHHSKIALEFADTIAKLRSPSGCPWDKEQTFLSLRPYLIEEAYETIEAINSLGDKPSQKKLSHFCEELGDILLQVYLHSQVALDDKLFQISDVFENINHKMITRHPHVFKISDNDIKNADDVKIQWEKIKRNEKPENSQHEFQTLLKKALKKRALPTLNFGTELSKRAKKIGFSWRTLPEVFSDVLSEVKELQHEIENNEIDTHKIEDEIGDVIFSLCNLVNFIKETRKDAEHFDFDLMARASCEKFINRFFEMEKIMLEKGAPLDEETAQKISLDQWNDLWSQAKKRRYR